MVSCLDITRLVTEYLEQTLGGEERAEFESHIEACEACRRYVEQMVRTVRSLGYVPPDPVPPEIVEEIRKRYESE